jgi:hypothetical protein
MGRLIMLRLTIGVLVGMLSFGVCAEPTDPYKYYEEAVEILDATRQKLDKTLKKRDTDSSVSFKVAEKCWDEYRDAACAHEVSVRQLASDFNGEETPVKLIETECKTGFVVDRNRSLQQQLKLLKSIK